jgi:hypothetical protein
MKLFSLLLILVTKSFICKRKKLKKMKCRHLRILSTMIVPACGELSLRKGRRKFTQRKHRGVLLA